MKIGLPVALLLLTFAMNNLTAAQTPEEFALAWDESHISNKPASDVRLDDLKVYLEKLKGMGVTVAEVGRSYGNREIYQAEWGKGPLKVFMWSQMHGDEPTATSALVDMLAFLQTNKEKREWVKKLHDSITLRVVPMLNPDGAEVFQRRNLQWIDINRDAQDLKTPEGQLLKRLRDEFEPDIGFNLHNQQELTTVGRTFKQATISVLAVSGRKDNSSYPGFERNKRICSLIVRALGTFIEGHIAKYDDTYNAQAFGDNISAWGSPVILIETGGYEGKEEDFLIRLNFIAFLTALQSLVDGSWETADPVIYESLPYNGSGGLFSLIFRNAEVVIPGNPDKTITADIGINRDRRRAQFIAPVYVRKIGDLSDYKGLEEIDVSGYYVVPKEGSLRPGNLGSFLFYKRSRTIDWASENLEKDFPPDAIYLFGKWLKPLE
jgi:hypothetical protein